VGGELPRTIDWNSYTWVTFMRKREEWLDEFARLCTDKVKSLAPDATVEHQASTYNMDWSMGVPWYMTYANDFLQGDFYGDKAQASYACKLFYNLTQNRPFGFETSSSLDLTYFTPLKSHALLKCKGANAIANDGAFIFIDSIDPVGSMNRKVYETMDKVYAELEPYEACVRGGEMVQEVGIYMSTASKYDPEDTGNLATDFSHKMPHIESTVKTVQALIYDHIPYGVITHKDLNRLSDYKAIALCNVLMMDDEEAAAFREYVKNGGKLLATRGTSFKRADGKENGNFMLADVFGADAHGETVYPFTYVAPEGKGEQLMDYFTKDYPIAIPSPQMEISTRDGTEVLAQLALPFTNPKDYMQYVSQHNNPPGQYTGKPALVLNRFGNGTSLYCAADVERYEHHASIITGWLNHIAGDDWLIKSDAPKAVEITTFHDAEKKLYSLRLLNFQRELPNIPVCNTKVSVRLDGKVPTAVRLLPENKTIDFQVEQGYVTFTVPEVETLQLVNVEYK